MIPVSPRGRPVRTVLLVAIAVGFWLFAVDAYILPLPDRVASADQSERIAWAED
ncbi:hypothetical protein ACFQS7_25135 [Dankookia sp. GCM10030260]|uniref:hypothetical protein n=1 Tax=Dankookia sp. GCM10030260 TaxID=3273390 RepID=UPI00360FB87B